ncbi:hypothetical protein M4R22_22200, partial [Acidovorax sp. GBBC 3334]|uniref:hypothetical protein n=1 Tax=Acidovorax sp. GBBC 3334 TaxID=2940496 RepID=UPI002302D55E
NLQENRGGQNHTLQILLPASRRTSRQINGLRVVQGGPSTSGQLHAGKFRVCCDQGIGVHYHHQPAAAFKAQDRCKYSPTSALERNMRHVHIRLLPNPNVTEATVAPMCSQSAPFGQGK